MIALGIFAWSAELIDPPRLGACGAWRKEMDPQGADLFAKSCPSLVERPSHTVTISFLYRPDVWRILVDGGAYPSLDIAPRTSLPYLPLPDNHQ
jgi:hypothetical protein